MRTLHLTNPLMHGADVKKAQVLLIKNGYLAVGEDDGYFGTATGIACERAKYYKGYTKADIKPTYGDMLNGFLTGTKLPKDYQVRADNRKGQTFVEFEQNALRQKILLMAQWGVANSHDIHYETRRPIDGINHPYHLPIYTDCSGFVTLCYNWAKVPDPNGRKYDGEGWTGTLLQHLKPVAQNIVKIADLVVFGNYPGHHVALIAAGPTTNPVLVSHGNEDGPIYVKFLDEKAAQPSGVHWLTLPSWDLPALMDF